MTSTTDIITFGEPFFTQSAVNFCIAAKAFGNDGRVTLLYSSSVPALRLTEMKSNTLQSSSAVERPEMRSDSPFVLSLILILLFFLPRVH